jgi:hypothetical protein
MKKKLMDGQVGLDFSAWVIAQKVFHSCMAIGKHSMLEKHDCYTNNASSNKGGIKKIWANFSLPKFVFKMESYAINFYSTLVCTQD